MPSAEDIAAKQRSIEAFFDDLQRRAALIERLFSSDYENEARLLCCCYIEGLGNWLNPSLPQGAQPFVKAIVDHGGEPRLALLLPVRLAASLPFKSVAPAFAAEIKQALAGFPPKEAVTESELFGRLPVSLTGAAMASLRAESWRGTVASIAYERIRSLGAHWLGSSELSFSGTTHDGALLPPLDYRLLKDALDRIIAHARTTSLASGKWFGHT